LPYAENTSNNGKNSDNAAQAETKLRKTEQYTTLSPDQDNVIDMLHIRNQI